MRVRIRLATPSDAEQVAMLCTQLGYSSDSDEMQQRLSQLCTHKDHAVLVAEFENQTLVGWVHAHFCDLVITPPQILIFGLVVDQQFHRQGIGRSLMQAVEQWALTRNCQTILVRSNILRTEAHKFYESIGYATIKQSKVFCKTLIAQPISRKNL